MKNEEENIDRVIREALRKEETDFYDSLEEQSLPEMMTGLYSGKMKWLAIVTTTLMLAGTGLAVFCAVHFFKVEALRDMMMYGSGFFLSMIMVSMLKLWNWMQMDKNALLREIKRLELQIALMKNKGN